MTNREGDTFVSAGGAGPADLVQVAYVGVADGAGRVKGALQNVLHCAPPHAFLSSLELQPCSRER